VTPHLFTTLAAALALCLGGAWVSYTDRRHAAYAPYLLAALAAGCGFLWGRAARLVPTPEDVVRLSLAWDAMVFAAYYAVPLLLWAKPSPAVVVGTALVVAGVLVAHLGE
jgi:hypothetical protein